MKSIGLKFIGISWTILLPLNVINVLAAGGITVPGGNSSLQGPVTDLNSLNNTPYSTADQLFGILKTIVQYTYTLFFIAAALLILFAAYKFLFARGDPERIKEARSAIMWAAIAIAIALISVAAAQIIQSFIGAGGPPSMVPAPQPPGGSQVP